MIGVVSDLRAWWDRRSLAGRFGLAGGVVLALACLVIGAVVSARIEAAVVRNSANATALFMESVIAPVSQQLASSDRLSPGAERALTEIFRNTPLGERVVAYKFWRRDGTILWASNSSLIGRRFAPTGNLLAAWDGQVRADFGDLDDAEDAAEATLGVPLLEVYSPIRAVWSGEVIAVAEFYEHNPELAADLSAARSGAWAIVGASGILLGSLLYAIVLGGSRTIEAQRAALDRQLAELRTLSDHNTDLRLRVQGAAARASTAAEAAMRRIGADLHDGPAQDLSFAALRLDSLAARADPAWASELLEVRAAVDRALSETRALSRGLALPELEGLGPSAILARVVELHELRSGHPVETIDDCGRAPALSPALRLCLFRVLQEGLSNAARHAGGEAVSAELVCANRRLIAAVRDRGPGPPAEMPRPVGARHLGLLALRDRVEALGGTFRFGPRPGGGAELQVSFDLGAEA